MRQKDVGWVYVITNKAMPGLVKVGFTLKNDPKERAKELRHTGSPYEYEVEYAIKVENPKYLEKMVHLLLGGNRAGKEWFKTTVNDAVLKIESASKSYTIFLKNVYKNGKLIAKIPEQLEIQIQQSHESNIKFQPKPNQCESSTKTTVNHDSYTYQKSQPHPQQSTASPPIQQFKPTPPIVIDRFEETRNNQLITLSEKSFLKLRIKIYFLLLSGCISWIAYMAYNIKQNSVVEIIRIPDPILNTTRVNQPLQPETVKPNTHQIKTTTQTKTRVEEKAITRKTSAHLKIKQPMPNKNCQYKPVMTDADYRACGIRPPTYR